MQSEAQPSAEPTQVELDQTKSLQLKKLSLEIAELERPWWKRPNYILAALPTLLAVVALSVGFLNGFFSAQLTKLDNQKHDLEAQIKEFEETKVTLLSQNDQLRQKLAKKQESISKIQPIAIELHKIESLAQEMKFEEITSSRGVGMGRRYRDQEVLDKRLQDLVLQLEMITAEIEK